MLITSFTSKPSSAPSLCTLPVDILIDIGLALPCREFGRLLQTSRYIHNTLNTHWIWHQRFVTRMGQSILKLKLKQVQEQAQKLAPTPSANNVGAQERPATNLSLTCEVSKEQLIQWYRELTRSVVPARDMVIIHMDNPYYWEMKEHPESAFGEVARLINVWWLDVSAIFYGVVPGRYVVQWNLIVNSAYTVKDTLFRAVTIPGHEIPTWDNKHPNTIGFQSTTPCAFINQTDSPHRNSFEGGPMILQLPDQLEVGPEHPTVFVQFRNHRGRSKDGLSVDYVRLVRVDDDREGRIFTPEPATEWKDEQPYLFRTYDNFAGGAWEDEQPQIDGDFWMPEEAEWNDDVEEYEEGEVLNYDEVFDDINNDNYEAHAQVEEDEED